MAEGVVSVFVMLNVVIDLGGSMARKTSKRGFAGVAKKKGKVPPQFLKGKKAGSKKPPKMGGGMPPMTPPGI